MSEWMISHWNQQMNQIIIIVVGFTLIVIAAYVLLELLPALHRWRKRQ